MMEITKMRIVRNGCTLDNHGFFSGSVEIAVGDYDITTTMHILGAPSHEIAGERALKMAAQAISGEPMISGDFSAD